MVPRFIGLVSNLMAIVPDRLRFAALILPLVLSSSILVRAQQSPSIPQRQFFIDCSAGTEGDGSSTHPWNSLAAAQAHSYMPGDQIAVARNTVCHGSFSPRGSGTAVHPIRLTAYGRGPRPRIVADKSDRQVLLLFNQEYWLVDSLDLSGAGKYGIFVTGNRGILHHIYLKNLFVHDVRGGEMKNKDNGLIVVGPGSLHVFFDDILVDGVVAAHTNQWAGILVGGGPFHYSSSAPLNRNITIRNSIVHDVDGDGIVLFRDSNSVIETSAAWQTGMQPTEIIGTPNAIWTWTCTDCIVRDNEAFLTDSPGIDGGAFDIDWDDTRNTIERNYAHDTQGYCFAVFAAGFVTSQSIVRDNLCVDNGQSPRLAALQGAAYLHSWNGGVLRGLLIEHNTFIWNPPISSAAAVVDDAAAEPPVTFNRNRIDSVVPFFYRIKGPFAPAENAYLYNGDGDAMFTLGERHNVTLAALQQAGLEKATTLKTDPSTTRDDVSLRLDATVDFALDTDGLLAPGPRSQLLVLSNLAAQYGPSALKVTVHLRVDSNSIADKDAQANALMDLDAGIIQFDFKGNSSSVLRLLASDGRLLEEWHGFQNAATLGGAVREHLGAPRFAQMR